VCRPIPGLSQQKCTYSSNHPMGSETISPTAHYTGYVWWASGLSHDAFATRTGRFMYDALRAPNAVARTFGLPTLPGMLLARHRVIDLRLARAIDRGEIGQVIEIAAGLSPRGWRFHHRYGDRITYIEADLPGMIAHKRAILARLGGESDHHRTVELDALAEHDLDRVASTLDPARGTAIITEGLLNYFDRASVTGLWSRIGRALARFPRGVYWSDLVTRERGRSLTAPFAAALGLFVRGRVHLDFADSSDIAQALASAGLDGVALDPRAFTGELPELELAGAGIVRVLEALATRA
jgi:O-methyltransferase involved in polyketide biosynthesis